MSTLLSVGKTSLLSVGKTSGTVPKIPLSISQQTYLQPPLQQTVRNFSVLNIGGNCTKTIRGSSFNLLNTDRKPEININQVRNYKVKDLLRLRCRACYFVKRRGRLYVECKSKGRHKQMQKLAKWKLYKDDYSKGNVVRAAFWTHHRDRYYKVGDKDVENFNWFADKLGTTV
ncbi:hypothetical protein LOTGIDRAFT_136847 [Lottia gigantea]|uniref:Ribosomal protein n=1 Tax=Lottia gigantea TaxID=225164 RepID=V4BC85_LOTGI|nr:hypothetical protein LOTGIDRAFT_136847 [Lottia gigantea]ESP03727.1 hypothetical protein LOTGIDRAFT_136847 [Lottia gigantea]